ncbi:MAG: hypothetical protein AAGL69_15060 [Pseudomonadota bacterium]
MKKWSFAIAILVGVLAIVLASQPRATSQRPDLRQPHIEVSSNHPVEELAEELEVNSPELRLDLLNESLKPSDTQSNPSTFEVFKTGCDSFQDLIRLYEGSDGESDAAIGADRDRILLAKEQLSASDTSEYLHAAAL